jgi:WD40 repeat protein
MKATLAPVLVIGMVFIGGGRWLAQEVKERATLKGHDATVNSVAFSPDGTLLA